MRFCYDNSPPPYERPGLEDPAILLATWFGAGYLPKAPGTWGSLGALPFAWVLVKIGGLYTLGVATALIFLVGLWASKVYMDKTGAHDPGAIVIDEVVGMWIVLLAAPLDPVAYAIGFVLFRVFDVFKPWPISWADRSIGGAFGVMIDDVMAGLAGLVVLALIAFYGEAYLTGGGL